MYLHSLRPLTQPTYDLPRFPSVSRAAGGRAAESPSLAPKAVCMTLLFCLCSSFPAIRCKSMTLRRIGDAHGPRARFCSPWDWLLHIARWEREISSSRKQDLISPLYPAVLICNTQTETGPDLQNQPDSASLLQSLPHPSSQQL